MRIKLNNRGFTLIEAIISIALLGIILTSFLGLLTTSVSFNLKSKIEISNGSIAQAVMEYYKEKGQQELKSNYLGTNSTAYLYIFYNKSGSGDPLKTALDAALPESGLPTEDYSQIMANHNPSGTNYDYTVKVVLSDAGDELTKINVTVWDSIKKDNGRINIVSLRGN